MIVEEGGERVPFTICDYDKEQETITLLVQEVGYSTHRMAMLKEGDELYALVGPLGNPTDLDEYKNLVLVGGGIGCAVIYPQAKLRKQKGLKSDVIMGARTKDLLFDIDEFKANSDNVYISTDDGSMGRSEERRVGKEC